MSGLSQKDRAERAAARERRRAHHAERRVTLALEYATASLRQMAARRGVSPEAVGQQLRRYGVPLRPRGGDSRRFGYVLKGRCGRTKGR
jgi:hypothetical protein